MYMTLGATVQPPDIYPKKENMERERRLGGYNTCHESMRSRVPYPAATSKPGTAARACNVHPGKGENSLLTSQSMQNHQAPARFSVRLKQYSGHLPSPGA